MAFLDGQLDQAAETLYLSSVTLAELLFGIRALPTGKRKDMLAQTLDGLTGLFRDRVLPFDIDAARHYAELAVTVADFARILPAGHLRIGTPFEKETVRQDGWSDVVDVLGRHAAGEEAVAPLPDNIDELIDLPARLLRRQTETPRLRHEVVDAGRATMARRQDSCKNLPHRPNAIAASSYKSALPRALGQSDSHQIA